MTPSAPIPLPPLAPDQVQRVAALELTHDERIDRLEVAMLLNCKEAACPVTHHWTPGLYRREIFMPAGSWVTSKIHRTEHPYFVLKGRVQVSIDGEVQEIVAPYMGVTKAGTRRLLKILEDTVWVTCHPINEAEFEARDVDAIETRIIEPRNEHRLAALAAQAMLPEGVR